MSHRQVVERPILGALMWLAVVILFCLLYACAAKPTKAVQGAGNSYFPLAVGNRWILESNRGDVGQRHSDTILIDEVATREGDAWYHMRCDWPGFYDGGWIRRDSKGNLAWTPSPSDSERQFLLFDAAVGTVWSAGLSDCADSLTMHDDYAVVTTPYGRFDGVRQISDAGRCFDSGWEVELARGVGPIAVSWVTIGGLQRCVLVEAQVKDDALVTSQRDLK